MATWLWCTAQQPWFQQACRAAAGACLCSGPASGDHAALAVAAVRSSLGSLGRGASLKTAWVDAELPWGTQQALEESFPEGRGLDPRLALWPRWLCPVAEAAPWPDPAIGMCRFLSPLAPGIYFLRGRRAEGCLCHGGHRRAQWGILARLCSGGSWGHNSRPRRDSLEACV